MALHRGRGLAARRADDPAPLEVQPAQLELELCPGQGDRADEAFTGVEVGQHVPVRPARVEGLRRPAQPAADRLRQRFLAAPDPQQLDVPVGVADRGALARGQRALDGVRAARRALDVDADLDARDSAISARSPGVGEVEAQRRPRAARACRAVRARTAARRARAEARRARTIRSAARATIQRGPAASRAARSRSSSLSSASSPAGARAVVPARPTRRALATCVIDSCQSRPRMVDNEGEGRLAPRASVLLFLPTSGPFRAPESEQ